MPKWVEQTLIGVAVVMFGLLAGGIIFRAILEIVFLSDFTKDDLTLSNVLTLLSILAAGAIAAFGWWLNRYFKIKEAERIAMAEAVVLYRRLQQIEIYVMAFLLGVVSPRDGSLIFHFFNTTTPEGREGFYKYLEHLSAGFLPHISDTDEYFKALRPLYVHEPALGEKIGVVLVTLRSLRVGLDYYGRQSLATRVERFYADENTEKKYFFKLLSRVVEFLRQMESCRRSLESVRFSPPLTGGELADLKECLEQLHGNKIDITSKHAGVDADVYRDMFGVAECYFRDMVDGFERAKRPEKK